jgi:phosphoribosylformylglycinamidine synthase
MAHRVEVALRPGLSDVLGERVAHRLRQHLGLNVRQVRLVDTYTIEDGGAFEPERLSRVAREAFSDPITQRISVDRPVAPSCDWVLEVGLRPGVTDNVGRTAREAVALILGSAPIAGLQVFTSRQYLLDGALGLADVERAASELLANPLVQTWRIAPGGEGFDGFAAVVPAVISRGTSHVEELDLHVDDHALCALSDARVLALSVAELHAIRDAFDQPALLDRRRLEGLGSSPTDVELECLAQSWSEHCKHKIFNARIEYRDETDKVTIIDGLFPTFIRGATEQVRHLLGRRDTCVTVFEDNAGVVGFDESWLLTFKVETHNSPSALDPYGGALTGIVGVNRDPMGTGLGAELLFNTDVFCFAPPDDPPGRGALPPRLLHPRRVLEGVREGVEHGGNKSGVPTVNGSVVFDERFLGKPLVYCGTGGIMPRQVGGRLAHRKEVKPGDRVVMVGGRVGKDGIHGATFSSRELDESSPASAVQIGDPITQKRMSDLLLRLRDAGLYRAITDNGAGGLSSSVGEMALLCGGADIDLSRVPLKYGGLAPWEILVSESQERMTLAVPPEHLDSVQRLALTMGVELSDLGQFTDAGAFVVRVGDRVVADLDLELLHDGAPRMDLHARWRAPTRSRAPLPESATGDVDLGRRLRMILARPNVCSKEYFVRQYDHEVQGGSVVKPLVGAANDGPSDAAVLRPRLSSQRALAISHGLCPRYGDLDTFHMAQCALDEALRSAVAVGGDPGQAWALDNFCWSDPVESERNPGGAYKLAQLVRACTGLYEACVAFQVPLISGKDSMKNDYRGGGVTISIPPTLLVSVMSVVPDADLAVTMDAKRIGDRVYVVGTTYPDLGRSELASSLGFDGGCVPQVRELSRASSAYAALHHAVRERLVASCHDCSDGGLAVCLAETAFAGDLGLRIELAEVRRHEVERDDELLFSESPCRLVVTVPADRADRFEHVLGDHATFVGEVTGERRLQLVGLEGGLVIDEPVAELKEAWQAPMRW